MDKITFLATFPAIQSAIKIAGLNDGMRIQLDIPETEIASAVNLLAMMGKILWVEVTESDFSDGLEAV